MTRLSVCICVYGRDGMDSLSQRTLPRMKEVEYVVSWQSPHGPVPESLSGREDVCIFPLEGRGLSRNRNHAMSRAKGDIVLTADDDADFLPEGLRTVIETLDRHPEDDFVVMKHGSRDTRYYNPPAESYHIVGHLKRLHFVNSKELAFRRSLYERGMRFDERFGVGTDFMTCGEEELLVFGLLRSGITGRYVPVEVCTTTELSTGERPITDPGVLRTLGAMIWFVFPWTGLLRMPWQVARLRRRGRIRRWLPAMLTVMRGWIWAFGRPHPCRL